MLKKTYTYEDFDGNERTEDFYFNLSKAELMEMELGISGGMVQKLKKIIAAQDGDSIIRTFKEIILAAYGEKSADGKRFDKSAEISKNFSHTVPYSMLFMELATNDDAASAFVEGIMPVIKEDKINNVGIQGTVGMPGVINTSDKQ